MPAPARYEAQLVDAELVLPLRKQVLRPWLPLEQLAAERDHTAGVAHGAVILDGAIVGVGSVMPDGHPHAPADGDWRVRGMATRADMRGRGIGSAVLAFCERHAREHGGLRLWCNARIAARGLYQRAGLSVEGDVFEVEQIGPHYLMSKSLA